MIAAPELTRRDLEDEVGRLIAAGRKRFLLAFYGTGADDTLEIGGTRVRVLAVRSELDLRRRLLDVAPDEYAAFLIPWSAASLPIDLHGRFARDGKIERVGRAERLVARLGVKEIDDEVRESPLVEYLLAHHATDALTIGAGRLTLDALWMAYLSRVWGFDAGGELALDALLGWAAIDGNGPRFLATLDERQAAPVRDALHAYLDKKLGPAGALVWRAWEQGRGAAALELALGLDALTGVTDSAASMWRRTTARDVFGAEVDAAALERLAPVAEGALRFLERSKRADAGVVRALVRAADDRVAIPELVALLVGSSKLPSAWRARLDQLGAALAEAAREPGPATVQVAAAAFRAVWSHDLARDGEQTSVLRRAEMALRLASWLAVRADRELPPPTTDYGDAEQLAGWYVREGGYVDRARRWARGRGDSRFAQGVSAVVDAVDAARQELDLRFARSLVAWHRAGRRATQVLPIDHAVRQVATKFLDEDRDRKLLVLLMDGMAWEQAVEILESMGARGSVWGPLAWHGEGTHRYGDAPFPPVIANFPTVTEISRSAFFAGKALAPNAPRDTSKDVERWRENRDVKKHVSASVVPQLRLRGEGQERDGSASREALDLVMDPSHRIAAVVINAIDMSLKADRTHETEWTVETLKALRDLLDKATEAGRAILLCSDHGHVPSDRLANTGQPMIEGARWRTWQKETDPLAPYEIGLPACEGVTPLKGAYGVALLADDAHRHGGGTGSGEHGGATLAESIAPCVLIGCADTVGAARDPGQAVRPVAPPSWWFFDVPIADDGRDIPADERRKPTKKPVKRPVATAQITMFEPPAPPEPPAPRPTPPPKGVPSTVAALAASELFQARATEARSREQVLKAVAFLRARQGVAAAQAFATELGEFASRVQGIVSKLQEILNVDGYQVLRYDRTNQQVHLDLEQLAQQFGVTI